MTDRGVLPRTGRHGIALGIVVVTSLVFAIAAYAVLFAANSLGSRANFQKRRAAAEMVAHAGLNAAMAELWANPTKCFPADPDYTIDTDGDPVTKALNVNIIATPCPGPGVTDFKISATVDYTT